MMDEGIITGELCDMDDIQYDAHGSARDAPGGDEREEIV